MPSGRLICFVCGSLGAETILNIKPQERGPYFPFLENHDPPKGCRLPKKDGRVDSCRVCYMFLSQQWETYERSRTPAIKRLYWLKRSDNGHFTGAEMRIQGEYIAQVMGLQYQPGVFDGGTSPGENRPENCSPVSVQRSDGRQSSDYIAQPQVAIPTNFKQSQGSKPSFSQENRHLLSQGSNNLPRNADTAPPRGALADGALDLSVAAKKIPEGGRVKLSHESESIKNICCFICTKECSINQSKLVSTCRQPTSEPYFPVLGHLPQANNPNALTKHGQVRVCVGCKNLLYQQWQAYEMSGIPMQHRTYKLYDDVSPLTGMDGNNSIKPREDQDTKPPQAFQHVCYLCGHLYPKELIQPLYTIPPGHQSLGTLFFPFIRDLQRPQGAHPLKSDGTVLACRNCFGDLYQQWQVFESEGTPLYRRPYSLSFLSKKITSESGHVTQPKIKQEVETNEGEGGPSSSSSDVSQPLNIQITESSTTLESSTSKSNTAGSQGLLAIATPGIGSVTSNTTCGEPPSWTVAEQMKKQQNQEQKSLTVPHPLQQVSSIPKKICFLCGTKSRISKMHILCSYPTRHEAKGANSQVVPFFPFLANRDPAPKAESMSEDGTVLACNICFHSLLKQWNEQEESKNPAENNRWLRKYTVPEMIGCYVCSKNVKRRNMQIIDISLFPSLKDHPVPANALVVDGGEGITACATCTNSLGHQYAEFERMGVPIEMRKYNWVNASQTDTAENQKADNQQDEDDDNQLLNVDENSSDSQGSGGGMKQTDDSLGQGSKPPPLTMISPAGAKLSRNTATVPPLNQVSPSNGVTSIGANAALNATRTSSFAAALRKLAHQAKDPEEGINTKHPPTPGSSSTSPRAVTPKRGPPPLVYSSHSSSLTSPPVVTIAPTQSHPTLVSSEAKQSLERAHSVQSTASSVYDPLSIKQDRDRPQSTHSNRDDDRGSIKDAAQSRRPHSGHSSTSPAASREELGSRGFQPYRPGEDLRHQLPPTMFGLDPAAYPYPTAFMPSHFPHPAFRFDDPVLLERYRMMQPPYLQFPHPGMIPPPGVHPFLAAGSRYPSELLHQQFAFGSQSSRLGEHISPALSERQRLEEERIREMEREKERERDREREREKEREAVLQRERERAREREKEYDKEKARDLYYSHQHQAELRLDPRAQDRDSRGRGEGSHSMANQSRLAKAEDSSGSKYSSMMHGSQRDMYGERTEKVHPYNDHPPRMEAERDKYGRESSYDRKSDIHPHSSEQTLLKNIDKHEFEKRAYSLAFADKQNMADRDRHSSSSHPPSSQYSSLHHADLAHKAPKDFFRPFDTANILTNGFNGSHDYDKYSVHYSKSSERTSKSPASVSRSSLEASQERRAILEESVLHMKGPRDSHLAQRRMSEDTLSSGRKSGEESLLLRSTEELQRRFSGVDRRNRRTPEEVSSNTNHNEYKNFLNNNIIMNMEKNNQDSKSSMSDPSNYQGNSNFDHKNSTALPSTFHHPYMKHIHSVISRLDMEERKLREQRLRSDYNSDDSDVESEDEEAKRQRLLFIRNGPPLPLDTSKPKMKFLNQLGLTSHRVKRDLEHQKQRKRRRSLRERSISPVVMVDGEATEDSAPSLPISQDLNSDALCQEQDYPEKCSFLSSMKLSTISPDKKKEMNHIQQVCEVDRLRRLANSGVKRKSSENSAEYSNGSKVLVLDKEGARAKSQNSLMSGNTFNMATDKTAILFPNKNKKKMLSREFAQEFHESVLQTTRQKELNNRLGVTQSRPGEVKTYPGKGDLSCMSRLVSNSGSTKTGGSAGCRTDHDTNGGVQRWPGIDSLLEAYQHHSDEQKLERGILMERCHHLQADNQDLNRTAESLSKRMAELMEQKRQASSTRNKLQECIDSLKKCTRDIR